MQWVLGNLEAIPTVTIDYKTYEAQGWKIDATPEDRFTNDHTGHGMSSASIGSTRIERPKAQVNWSVD